MLLIDQEKIATISSALKNENILKDAALSLMEEESKHSSSFCLSSKNYLEKIDKNTILSVLSSQKTNLTVSSFSPAQASYNKIIYDISDFLSHKNSKDRSIYIHALSHFIPKFIKVKDLLSEKEVNESFLSFFKQLSNVQSKKKMNDIKRETNVYCNNDSTKKVIDIILNYCSRNVQIEIKQRPLNNNQEVVCKIYSGKSFYFEFPDMFYSKINVQSIKNSKILIIDGMIENVHEIHHVLEKFSFSKENLIIVASNYGHEVLNTLLVNYQNNNLNIFPVIIPNLKSYKEELFKLSKFSNCMFLSQDFGDKINVIREDHYGEVLLANIFKDRKKIIFKKKGGHKVDAEVLEIYVNTSNSKCNEIIYDIDASIKRLMFSIKRGLIDFKDIENVSLSFSKNDSKSDNIFREVVLSVVRTIEKNYNIKSISIERLYDYCKNIISTCQIFMNTGVIIAKEE